MTDTMLERMARAIGDSSPMISPVSDWVDFLPCAKAALQAIREPSEEMIAVGTAKVNAFGRTSNGVCNAHRAMIDHILKGEE